MDVLREYDGGNEESKRALAKCGINAIINSISQVSLHQQYSRPTVAKKRSVKYHYHIPSFLISLALFFALI